MQDKEEHDYCKVIFNPNVNTVSYKYTQEFRYVSRLYPCSLVPTHISNIYIYEKYVIIIILIFIRGILFCFCFLFSYLLY